MDLHAPVGISETWVYSRCWLWNVDRCQTWAVDTNRIKLLPSFPGKGELFVDTEQVAHEGLSRLRNTSIRRPPRVHILLYYLLQFLQAREQLKSCVCFTEEVCSFHLQAPNTDYMFSVLFQMNASFKDMNSSFENDSIVHLPEPIFPEKLGSNVTIIQTGNGSIEDQLFLNTVAAQALSGIFVWSALLMTCHQVSQVFLMCACLRKTKSLHFKALCSL